MEKEGGGSLFQGARRGPINPVSTPEINTFPSTPVGESTSLLHSTVCFHGSVYRMHMLLFNIRLGEESKLISVCEKLADSISDWDLTSK